MKKDDALAFIFPLICLWDFYLGEGGSGIRIFDLLAISIYFFASLLKLSSVSYRIININKDILMRSAALVLLCITYGLVGMITGNADFFRPVLGIWIGVLIFFSIVTDKTLRIQKFYGAIDACLVVISCSILLQFYIFHSFGYLLNFQAITGGEPRVFSSIFRPSGMYLEPSSHSFTVFMLIALRVNYKRNIDAIYFISIAGIIISLSLFGVFLSILILIYLYKNKIFMVNFIFIFILAIAYIFIFEETEEVISLLDRASNLSDDNSIITRYGFLLEKNTIDFSTIFGIGLTNNYHNFGTSGLAFLLSSFGVLGTFSFVLLISAVYKANSYSKSISIPFVFLSSFCVILLAAPIWTTMFLWVWFALQIRLTAALSNNNL
jgi:hypothetical protein